MSAAVDTITPPAAPSANLCAGIVRAQRAAHKVAKGGRNDWHGYSYASAEDVIQVARDALAEGGLAMFCTSHEVYTMLPARAAKSLGEEDPGEEETLGVRVHYVLAHESGETREIISETPVIPEKGRPLDKAVAAAKTFDLSYTLRGVLLLPRGDEKGGVDARDDREAGRRGQRRGPARDDRREAPRERAPEPQTPAPAAQTPAHTPTSAGVEVTPLRRLWLLAQAKGWRSEEVADRAAQMFGGATVRALDDEQLAKLTSVVETEAPPTRDATHALEVTQEARDDQLVREAQEAAAEDYEARAQQHMRGSPRRR